MVDLAGIWDVVDDRGEYRCTGEFPGDIHTALLGAGIIPDPFVGTNEDLVQWVGRRGWTISRTFEFSGEARRVLLEIPTIDTVAEIRINGSVAGRCTNMFVPGRFDVVGTLQEGTNTIEIVFESPETVAAGRASRLAYPVPHQMYPNQSVYRNLLRKVQCHSSWDWGIALMVSGIYGSVSLRPVGDEALKAVYAIPRRDGKHWNVPVHIEWDRPGAPVGSCDLPEGLPDAAVTVELRSPSGDVVAAWDSRRDSRRDGAAPRIIGRGALVVDLPVKDPELWWPAGYGGQPLYTVTVSFRDGDGTVTDEASFRTAFRTVEVVNEKDETGRSLFFRVNGREVWAKGSNWIPPDAFPSRQTPDRYRTLLSDAVEANMNMIRVWGGGQYEGDLFYDICDELGLLVWQDFMFSCSLYPSERWFLDEVRQEVRAQVRRLMSHPSIALWCGNNENIGALGWYEESRQNPGRYLIDFDRLNHGVIAEEVHAADDSRVFWPSSPAAGEGNFSDNWHDDSSGDMHYWSVWHEGKPFSAYYEVTPRFCSEFGFQSFPDRATLERVVAPEQLNPTSPQMEHHQRNPRGNTVILETMSRYFRFPFDVDHFLYLSQVQQAMAIGMAVDYWRSRRPVSMGALYWQLNDLWPVVSWSGIDYYGRWKLLHYHARRFFAPRRVAVIVRESMVTVHGFNDTTQPMTGTLTVKGVDWEGRELWKQEHPALVPADSAAELWRGDGAGLFESPSAGFVVAEFGTAGAGAASGETPLREYGLLCEFKAAPLKEPAVTVEPAPPEAQDRDGVFSVRLGCADAPAFWVTPRSGDDAYQPDDAGFFMLPGESRVVSFLHRGGWGTTATDGSSAERRAFNISIQTIKERR
jgi:beta-mannosidase